MRTVAIADVKDHLSELVDAAEAGEEIVITRHGKPAARLMALQQVLKLQSVETLDTAFETLAQQSLQRFGPVQPEEIVEWKNEGRT